MSTSCAAENHAPPQHPTGNRIEHACDRIQSARIRNIRNNVQSIVDMRGRNTVGSEENNVERAEDAGSRPSSEGPKTPRFTIMMPTLPSTRLIIPYLRRSMSSGTRSSMSSAHTSRRSSESAPALPSTTIMPWDMRAEYFEPVRQEQLPEPLVTRQGRRERDTRRSRGIRSRRRSPSRSDRRERETHENQQISLASGPEEQELAHIAAQGRRRRERRKTRPAQNTRTRSASLVASVGPAASPAQQTVRRKHRAVKKHMCRCVASGMLLMLQLIIYLSLALTSKIQSQEFHVIIILTILVTTVFFSHSFLRLCITLIQPASSFAECHRRGSSRFNINDGGGYANPEHPIRVQILRDEEAAGIESEATKFPPPAYGLWRETVRVDPNRIYWARNIEAVPEVPSIPSEHRPSGGDEEATETPTSMPRPPSYVSENGVDYVVEARGRSIAPPPSSGTTEMPLEHANQVTRNVERR